MRVLAVDPGSKRVGIALSDPTGTIAQARPSVPAEPHDTLAARLAAIADENGAARIVVGVPRRLDGSAGPEAKAARELATALHDASGLPVELWDERLTTVAAERALISGGVKRGKRREMIDGVAAALLLQSHPHRKRWATRSL